MALVDLDWSPQPRKLRGFGIILGLLLLAISARAAWTHRLFGHELATHSIPLGLAGLALVAMVIALTAPQLYKWPFVLMSLATFPIGLVVSYALLISIYFIVVTPMGLVMRLIGRDALDRRLRDGRASYFIERPPPRDLKSYFRQS